MLTNLSITNYALIDALELEFSSGFSVLTGETGAGKSIALGALQLVLGGRSSASNLRSAEKKVDIGAVFSLKERPSVAQWLADHDLEPEEDELLLRRVIGVDGRSRAYINGVQTPVQKMRELGQRLVEIHGQHEFQTLVKALEQQRLLDLYANNDKALDQVMTRFTRWRDLTGELEHLRSNGALSPAERELLRHQVDELERTAVSAEALDKLHARHKQLANAETLIEVTDQANQTLADDITGPLALVLQNLGRQRDSLPALDEPIDLLQSALLQAQEAETVLARHLRELDADPAQVAALDQQLDTIHTLARKHRIAPEDLAGHLQALKDRYEQAENAEDQEQELVEKLAEAEKAYRVSAKKLSQRRAKAARGFATAITETLHEVGMDQAAFTVEVTFDAKKPPSQRGLDSVTFNIQTNPGSPAGSLDNVASGGELSRVALAVKVALTAEERGRTMIFDEVDTGVGGATAQMVGQKLRQLARQSQVISVTHLPQVAACGHQHYRVEKHQKKDQTTTHVTALNEDERLQELARMLGGVKITRQTKAHAAEMLSLALNDKQSS
ncbi:MAG: DNA repair protein RecN [Lysobacterales bacterium]